MKSIFTNALKKRAIERAEEKLNLLFRKKYSAEIYWDFASKNCTANIFHSLITNFFSNSYRFPKANAANKENYRMLKEVALMFLTDPTR